MTIFGVAADFFSSLLRTERAFYAAQEETLDMNEKGAPYTWSIAQDNIILVLDGKLPEEEFLKFQEVLLHS